MPMYDYQCDNGHKFEDLQTIANRHRAECMRCGTMAKMQVSAPRIDPNADLPGARMMQRRQAERRGRGADMTAANKTVQDYGTQEDAHAKRAVMGENPIVSVGKK